MLLTDILWGEPSHLWRLTRQMGITTVVALLDGGEQDQRMFASVGKPSAAVGTGGDAPWGEPALRRLVDRFDEHGFDVSVIEDTPPLDLARLGLPGRDEQIDNLITQVRAMGRVGIPTLCYNWMALSSWARTSVVVPSRGGAFVTGYDESLAGELAPLAANGELTPEQLWSGLEYMLDAVVPVAEESGVRLALHPDDPPRSVVRGVPRIFGEVAAFERLLELAPSHANAITLCQGNFALMTDDLPSTIAQFLRQDAVAFVHFRDVRGTADSFVETFHDDGQTDLVECMRVYAEHGYTGPVRADHVPTMDGESNRHPGYETLGRLYANGYIRGLINSAYRS